MLEDVEEDDECISESDDESGNDESYDESSKEDELLKILIPITD
ncbi:hypothetical protein [Fastidiosipila sanguinis]|nr:hypothetical protein [Fastidiosipila sanguinis]